MRFRHTKMRRSTIIFLVINLIIIGLLTNQCRTLIALLFEDAARFAIPGDELKEVEGGGKVDGGKELIPKIIHQTYINETIPEKWKKGQQACVNLHADYEYIVRHLIVGEVRSMR